MAAALFSHPQWIVWVGIPTPDTGLVPNRVAQVSYGLAFAFGWLAAREEGALNGFGRLAFLCLPVAGLATFACLALGAEHPVPEGQVKLVLAGAYALAAWCWTISFIGIPLLLIRGPSRAVRYVADASYWLYLIHLPIVMALQVLVHDWASPGLAKFGFILGTSVPLMLLSYQLLVRRTVLGRLLNGKPAPNRGTSSQTGTTA
jgi:peptidoglycan/LPS O-acetylase OafA/YrhL